MVIRSYLGDRRTGLRFQINGELWGSIDVRQDLIVRNITTDGALLEGRLPERLRELGAALLRLSADGPDLTVSIRHISPLDDERCLVGIQFLQLTNEGRQALLAFISSATKAS